MCSNIWGSPACAGRSNGRSESLLYMWYVYIIKSFNKNWYYIGSTNSIERRINEHNNQKVKATKAYIPFKLVWLKEFKLESEARNYERLLKDKRIEKEKIIRNLNC